MNSKKIKLSLLLFVLAGFTCTVLWLAKNPSVQGRAPSVAQDIQIDNRLARLNRKAKASKGTDPIAVRDLTDEVFTAFALPEIPPFTLEAMKERVGRAEVNYRQRAHKGISEVKVAKTINELAEKFALPGYSKVSVAMVRTTRVGLMVQLPRFIAQDDPTDKKHKKKLGSSINPFMSPLEATAVTLYLLQQKTINEAFQVTHDEFFANMHKRQMQRWEQRRAQRDGTAIVDSGADRPMLARSSSKTNDSRQAVKSSAAQMNPDELLNLAESSLDTLGIKR